MTNNVVIHKKDGFFSAILQWKLPRKTCLFSSKIINKRINNQSNYIKILQLHYVRVKAVYSALGIYNVEIGIKKEFNEIHWVTVYCSNKVNCSNFALQIESNIKTTINNFELVLRNHFNQIEYETKTFFDREIYIKRSELREWERNIRDKQPVEKIEKAISVIIKHPFLNKNDKYLWEFRESWFKDLLSITPNIWLDHNDTFIQQQYISNKAFFDTVESSALTEHQARASLIFDDANLTLAAAGSGKTSVIVAKIGYAISSNNFSEKEIIALAYNTDAMNELKKRIPEKLSKVLGREIQVQTNTFHSLGRFLLGNRPDGQPWDVLELDSDGGEVLFNRAYENLISGNTQFRQALLEWVSYARYPEPEIETSEGTLEEHEKRYMQACMKQIRIKKEQGAKGYQPQIPTFKPGIKVRSIQEARIVNWLYLHNVNFDYEKPDYSELAENLGVGKSKSGKQKPYCPDFTYKNPESGDLIYHEHFGINSNGNAPKFIGGKHYEDRVKAKRHTFDVVFKSSAKHRFFETCSGDFYDGTIFQKLEKALISRGIAVQKANEELENKVLKEYAKTTELKELFIKFITTFRDSGLKMEDIIKGTSGSKEEYRAKKFLNVVKILIPEVERVYREAGAIEFSDMLSKGISEAKINKAKLPYKFILVDEFQDSSRLKIELVKAVARNHKGSVIFFVGDDWQAINRFSGSDISIFQQYLEYNNKSIKQGVHLESDYRSTHVVELPDTFRYPQGIANVSREIILKNPTQIDKPVTAKLLTLTEKTVRVVEHSDNAKNRLETLDEELKRITKSNPVRIEKGKKTYTSVFILTRNIKETVVPEGLESESLNKILEKYKSMLEIKRISMHKSKGLEADFTIIVGMDSGFKGFPSEMKSDPLLDLVLPKSNGPLDEERRLFYVAITRSKKQSILLTAAERPSIFVTELKKMKHLEDCFDWVHSDIEPKECPCCKIGYLRQMGDKFSSCTRFPICGYTISEQIQS